MDSTSGLSAQGSQTPRLNTSERRRRIGVYRFAYQSTTRRFQSETCTHLAFSFPGPRGRFGMTYPPSRACGNLSDSTLSHL